MEQREESKVHQQKDLSIPLPNLLFASKFLWTGLEEFYVGAGLYVNRTFLLRKRLLQLFIANFLHKLQMDFTENELSYKKLKVIYFRWFYSSKIMKIQWLCFELNGNCRMLIAATHPFYNMVLILNIWWKQLYKNQWLLSHCTRNIYQLMRFCCKTRVPY